MKLATISFSVVLVVMLVIAAWQGRLAEGFKASGHTALQVAPMFILAFLVMGFMDVLIPKGWVERWLTDQASWRGLGLAWIAGVLTPGGSGIGMPLAAGLLTTGASPAVVVTYLTSLATLNLMRMPMEVGFYGVRITVLRVVSCLVLPFLAGGLTRLVVALGWWR